LKGVMIMNKKGFLKVLIISLVMLMAAGLLASRAMASLQGAIDSFGTGYCTVDPNGPEGDICRYVAAQLPSANTQIGVALQQVLGMYNQAQAAYDAAYAADQAGSTADTQAALQQAEAAVQGIEAQLNSLAPHVQNGILGEALAQAQADYAANPTAETQAAVENLTKVVQMGRLIRDQWVKLLLTGVSSMKANIATQEMMQLANGQPAPNGKFVGPTFLLDNFQYWKEPRSMGWTAEEPDYPVYGAGIGYGDMRTVVDFEEGSRVLDVNRATSVFLPFNNPQLMPYRISKAINSGLPIPPWPFNCFPSCTGIANCGAPLPGLYNMLSFKVRAPLAIEQFDTFRMIVNVVLTDGSCAQIVLWPKDKYTGCNLFGAASVDTNTGYVVGPGKVSTIDTFVGRQFQDGTWHLVMVDLNAVANKYTNGAASLLAIVSVDVLGNVYRLDDIMFTIDSASLANNHPPYLFRIGPVYGTLFGESVNCPAGAMNSTCVGRLIYAEDPDLYLRVQNLYDLGTPGVAGGGTSVAQILGSGVNPVGPFVIVKGDNLNPNLGLAEISARQLRKNLDGDLEIKLTMDGPLGPMTNSAMARPVTVQDIQNNVVTYLPQWEVASNEWFSGPLLLALCNALQRAGYTLDGTTAGVPYIPGARILQPTKGQVLEDMIMTCRVTDNCGLTDEETFPVSIVNYINSNLPPLLEQLEDRFFQVGQIGTYQITATDPDPQDMGLLTYKATLDGLSSYQFGPWMSSIINPQTGTVSFQPEFEGALTCIVTVSDPRGMSAVGHFTIFCVNGGSAGGGWYNHAPIVSTLIQSPQEVTAGRLFVLKNLHMADPDNQPLYYSCNVGAVGVDGIYTFQSEFAGEYLVQITGYDPLGGAVTQQFILNVLPWWSI
jgi:hypothetical protein